jgi:hypothetical protein
MQTTTTDDSSAAYFSRHNLADIDKATIADLQQRGFAVFVRGGEPYMYSTIRWHLVVQDQSGNRQHFYGATAQSTLAEAVTTVGVTKRTQRTMPRSEPNIPRYI